MCPTRFGWILLVLFFVCAYDNGPDIIRKGKILVITLNIKLMHILWGKCYNPGPCYQVVLFIKL